VAKTARDQAGHLSLLRCYSNAATMTQTHDESTRDARICFALDALGNFTFSNQQTHKMFSSALEYETN